VFDAADVLIDRHPLWPLRRDRTPCWRERVGVAQEVPRRSQNVFHWVGLAMGPARTDRNRSCYETPRWVASGDWPVLSIVTSILCEDRQLVLRAPARSRQFEQ